MKWLGLGLELIGLLGLLLIVVLERLEIRHLRDLIRHCWAYRAHGQLSSCGRAWMTEEQRALFDDITTSPDSEG
jgi:hypothetical protein